MVIKLILWGKMSRVACTDGDSQRQR